MRRWLRSSRNSRLKALGERLERDASVMSDADRLRRQREFSDLEKDFQRRQREFREDLNQRRNEELAQVIDKANRAIKQIAEQENYDIILQEAVFASPRIDITDKVLRALAYGLPLASARSTLSVMSIRGLAKTASCRMMS